jgi:DNA-binding response OmpR family regulator
MTHILIVDDDDNILELLNIVLSVHGYSVKTARTGKEAIAAFIERPYNLVLTDIDMPELDGNVLVRFVKACSHHVPVVALTGEKEKASELFDRVLDKPFYTRELISTIEELLLDEHALAKQYAQECRIEL